MAKVANLNVIHETNVWELWKDYMICYEIKFPFITQLHSYVLMSNILSVCLCVVESFVFEKMFKIANVDLSPMGLSICFYRKCSSQWLHNAYQIYLSNFCNPTRADELKRVSKKGGVFPADTLRNNDIIITSKLRHFDVVTSFWRYNDVFITPYARWVVRATYYNRQL